MERNLEERKKRGEKEEEERKKREIHCAYKFSIIKREISDLELKKKLED